MLLNRVLLITKYSLYLKISVENLQFTDGGCISAMSQGTHQPTGYPVSQGPPTNRVPTNQPTLTLWTQVTPYNEVALDFQLMDF